MAAAIPGLVLWRAGLVLAALIAAGATLRNGVARYSPDRARSWAHYDARVAAASAAERLSTWPALRRSEQRDAALGYAEAEARRALARDLTVVSALATLGMVADISGDGRRANRFMEASSNLSRRHLPTRLWLIEHAVQGNDVQGALKNFDIALRTSKSSSDILFPILANALADRALVMPIGRLLESRPPWAGRFIYAAVASGVATENVAQIFQRLDPRPVYADVDLTKLLIDTLIAQRKFGAARALSRAGRPAARTAALIEDPQFRQAQGQPPFTWQLMASPEIDAIRGQDSNGRSALVVTAHATGNGPVASQLLSLPSGNYLFRNAIESEGSLDSSPVWTLTCAQNETVLGGRLEMPLKGGAASAVWTVPAGCDFQWLRLNLNIFGSGQDRQIFVLPVGLSRK